MIWVLFHSTLGIQPNAAAYEGFFFDILPSGSYTDKGNVGPGGVVTVTFPIPGPLQSYEDEYCFQLLLINPAGPITKTNVVVVTVK